MTVGARRHARWCREHFDNPASGEVSPPEPECAEPDADDATVDVAVADPMSS